MVWRVAVACAGVATEAFVAPRRLRGVGRLTTSSESVDCASKEECAVEALELSRVAERLTLEAEKLRLEATLEELALTKERLEASQLKDAAENVDATFASAAAQLEDKKQRPPAGGPPPPEEKEQQLVTASVRSNGTVVVEGVRDGEPVELTGFDLEALERALQAELKGVKNVEIIGSRGGGGGDDEDLAVEVLGLEGMRLMDTNEALRFLFPGAPAMKMTPARAQELKAELCSLKSFNADAVDVCDRGVVLRGTLRTAEPAQALRRVEAKLRASPALSGDFRLFLLEDPLPIAPEDFENRVADAQMRLAAGDAGADDPFLLTKRPPVLVAVARSTLPVRPGPSTIAAARAVSGAATTVSLLAYSVSTGALNDALYEPLSRGDPAAVDAILPVGAFVVALSLCHEAAHAVMAARTNVSWSAPLYALPCLSTGTLGATNFLGDFAPNRKALFDTAIAGPLVGLGAGLAALFLGSLLAAYATPEVVDLFPRIPVATLRSSALGAVVACAGSPGLATSVLGGGAAAATAATAAAAAAAAAASSATTAAGAAPAAAVLVPMHPLALAGLVAILTNALQLLPLGRTDGARALLALLGRPFAMSVSALAMLVASIVGIVAPNDLLLFHIIFVFALQRDPEAPCVDELTPIGETRKSLYVLALGIALLALLPAPFTTSPIFGSANSIPAGFPSI